MSILPPKPKKPQIIPVPLILVVVFIVAVIAWGQITSVPGKRLVILHTNDLQGQIMPFSEAGNKAELGGFARIAAKVQEFKESADNVILLDAGDTIQGTLFTKVFGGVYVGELMSKIGYNAVTIGEHDFDEGPEGLKNYIKSSSYPFLAANVDISESKELNGLIAPYVILDVNSLKVGVFGLITPDANLFAKTGPYVKIADPKEASRKVIDEIKPKSDIIIALTHLGITEDRKLASSVSGIDVIVGGGSKTKLSVPIIVNNPEGGKTIIVQAKNQGQFLGKLEVAVKDKKTSLVGYKLLPIDNSVVPEPKLAEIINKLQDKLEKESHKAIGSSNVEFDAIKSHIRTSETNLGDLFAQAIKEAFPEVDIALQNSGGIRGEEIKAKGNITMKDVWEWHPYENKIVLVTLTGKQVKEVIERGVSSLPISKGTFLQVAGLSYTVDLTGLPQELSSDNAAINFQGDRVMDIKVNGKPLNYNQNYRVAVNDFMVNGGDGFVTLAKAQDIVITNKSLVDVVVAYIKKHSPINIQTDGRIKVKGGLLK